MTDVYTPLKCCGKFMRLVTSYYHEGEDWFVFQCEKCGSCVVEKGTELELK